MWPEIEKVPQEQVGFLLIQQPQLHHILQLNDQTRYSLSENLPRSFQLLVQSLLYFCIGKQLL